MLDHKYRAKYPTREAPQKEVFLSASLNQKSSFSKKMLTFSVFWNCSEQRFLFPNWSRLKVARLSERKKWCFESDLSYT